MIADININCDGNWMSPEIQLSGSAKALAHLGSLLNEIKTPMKIHTVVLKNKFYPVSIDNLFINPKKSGNDRLSIKFDEENLQLEGTLIAINKIGDSLINFFDDESKIGDHFHLDYYEGNQVLNETNCRLVFICDQ